MTKTTDQENSLLERAASKLDDGGLFSPADEKVPAAAPLPTAAPAPQPSRRPRDMQSPSRATQVAAAATGRKDIPAQDDRPIVELDMQALASKGYIVPEGDVTLQAEEFRIIKRSLLLNAFGRGEKKIKNGNLILVTSSQPNEGKTHCALNLALSMASEQDVTVLLVDADFSKPEALAQLDVQADRGLMDVVSDPSIDLSDCLLRTNVPNLSLLPAGMKHNRTTELLASDRMGQMVEEIAQRYADRVVIFDSPPVLASSAAPVLALHVGQVLFVVESEKTSEQQIRDAIGLMSGCKNINMILNKIKVSIGANKFGKYYGYYGYS